MLLYVSDESKLEDISFDHIRFELTDSKLNDVAGGNIDLRGSNLQQSLFEKDLPGFYAQYIKGLRINDFKLTWTHTRMNFFTNGIEIHHFEDADIKDFKGSASPINPRAFRIYGEDGKDFKTNDSTGVSLKNVL